MTGWNLPPGVTGSEPQIAGWSDELVDYPSEQQLQNWNEANDYTHEGEEDDEEHADELRFADAHIHEAGPNDADAAEVQVYGFEAVAEARGYKRDEPDVTPYRNCPTCGGLGHYVQYRHDMQREHHMCPTCGGTGRVEPASYDHAFEADASLLDDDPGPVPDEVQYPDGLPTLYTVFQLAGDRTGAWYAVWLELDGAGEPYKFWPVPDDKPVTGYATQEEARRACWRDEWGFAE